MFTRSRQKVKAAGQWLGSILLLASGGGATRSGLLAPTGDYRPLDQTGLDKLAAPVGHSRAQNLTVGPLTAPGMRDPVKPDSAPARPWGQTLLARWRVRDQAGRLLQSYALVLVWVAMAAVFTALRPSTFLSSANLQTIFGSQSILVFLTLALLITLTVGEFDLSVASILGLSATTIAVLNGLHGISIGFAILAALGIGVAVGFVNGFLVVYVGVDAIVATLGMGTFVLGIALLISESYTIGGISTRLSAAVNDHFLGLPRSFWYGLVMATLIWYVVKHTPLGRHALFVGQGRDVARLTGIEVDRIRWGAFILGGLVAAIAGCVAAGVLGAFQASSSGALLLPAFAAAFLGSTAVTPGRFNAWGSVIAIYFLITGITGLQLLGFSGWIEQVFYGGALMVAVSVSVLVRRRVVA